MADCKCNRILFSFSKDALYDKASLENLGFTFLDSGTDKSQVFLPESWTVEHNSCYWYTFFDSIGNPIVSYNRVHNVFFIRS